MDLIEKVGSKIAYIYRKRFQLGGKKIEPLKIKPNQFIVLMYVGRNPGLNQSELNDLLCLEKTNISRILKALEERDLIEKRLNSIDKRNYRIYLSQKGEEVLDRLKGIFNEVWREHLQGVSEEELEIFRRVLDKILENIGRSEGDIEEDKK